MSAVNTLEFKWRSSGANVRLVGAIHGGDASKAVRRVLEAPTLGLALDKAVPEAMTEIARLAGGGAPQYFGRDAEHVPTRRSATSSTFPT